MNIIPARYTEVLVNLMNDEEAKAKIDQAMSTYPLYVKKSTEEYIPSYIPTREELNNAILNYYKYREIGFETFGRFLFELETALNEIMPYYNQLYFSTDQDYDLLFNVDYTREISRNREDTNQDTSIGSGTNQSSSNNQTSATDSSTTSATSNNYNKSVSSSTPQGSLSITASNIDNVTYADEVKWNHDNGTQSGSSQGSSSSTSATTNTGSVSNRLDSNGGHTEDESTTERVKGNYGQMSYQTLLGQYRDLILNVTQQIINDERIAELFMMIY